MTLISPCSSAFTVLSASFSPFSPSQPNCYPAISRLPNCDRDDYDGVHELPADWIDISQVQSFEESQKACDFSSVPGMSPFDGQTHLGVHPERQQLDEPSRK